MRRWFVLLGLVGFQVEAQTDWFTVTGNPRDASVDTVEVDPVVIKTKGALKTMNVRVSRATERLNWEKVPYRSYESQVIFDCRARKAEYLFAAFYPVPLWQGQPHKITDYANDRRPMRFLDVEPNPTNRIIRAACRAAAG